MPLATIYHISDGIEQNRSLELGRTLACGVRGHRFDPRSGETFYGFEHVLFASLIENIC